MTDPPTLGDPGIKKTCPACKTAFDCQQGDITKCFCYKIKLTRVQLEALAARWRGCLCSSCLGEISREL